MRILTFTTLFPNTVDPTYAIFVYQRCAHLAKRPGNELLVISPVPYFPRWLKTKKWRVASEIPPREKFGSLSVYHPRYFLLPKISMPWHAISMFLGCLRLAVGLNREKKIDCIDAHFVYPDGFAAVLLGACLNVPVVVSARGTDINLFPSFRLIRPMIRWTLDHANGVIAVSGALKKSMVELGIAEQKIRIIRNGVDSERFQPMPAEIAKGKLHLSPDSEIVVSVGSLISSKCHDLLIRAFRSLLLRHSRLQLYIVGEGPQRRKLENLVQELKLTGSVHLSGKRPNDELRLWFSAANVSCLISAREGWPNVLTESLACGTPVVATSVGGIPEIIYSEQLGILVEQTVESITMGLERALMKNWNRGAISRQTRTRTWDLVAAEVEEVLRAELDGHTSHVTGSTSTGTEKSF